MEDLWEAGEVEPAQAEALRRTRASSEDGMAWKLLGVCRARGADVDGALTALKAAQRLRPGDAEVERSLGRVAWHANEPETALAAYCRAADLAPTWGEALTELVQVCARMGRRELSAQYLEKAVSNQPENLSFLYSCGVVNKEREAYDAAIAQFQRIVQLDPDYTLAYNEMGLCEYSRGHNEAAEGYFEQANAADPAHATPYYNHGILLLDNNRYSEAAAKFGNAVACKPDHIDAQFGLIRTYERMSAIEDGEAALEAAKAVNGAHTKLEAVAARLALRRGNIDQAGAGYVPGDAVPGRRDPGPAQGL